MENVQWDSVNSMGLFYTGRLMQEWQSLQRVRAKAKACLEVLSCAFLNSYSAVLTLTLLHESQWLII